jgi:hypothetical protein
MPMSYVEHEPSPIVDQPPPAPNERPHIADLVIADIQERKRLGVERYGVALQPHNGRDALVDLYQELLDGAKYARQKIEERDDHRAEGAAAEREKIVGYLMHYAGLAAPDCDGAAEYVAELAQAIQRGEHHDTWPAPPPDSDDDLDGANTATEHP